MKKFVLLLTALFTIAVVAACSNNLTTTLATTQASTTVATTTSATTTTTTAATTTEATTTEVQTTTELTTTTQATTTMDPNLISAGIDDLYRVYYEIFVGAFSDSDGDGMGDLQGIINRLDYLNDGDENDGQSLGVQGIWLMPIMPSPSYHKYDVMNYEAIDPHYGTLDDFSELVQKANARGIDIIIDLVLNHTSDQHPWFKAARQAIIDGDMTNKYIDYYDIVTSDQRENGKSYSWLYGNYYYEANFSSSMPELNMDDPDVKAEIVNIMQFWYDLGVKGFRLDAVKWVYLNDDAKNIAFWNWFVGEAKSMRSDTYIVGEDWSPESHIAEYYQCFSNFDFGMATRNGEVANTALWYNDVSSYVDYLNNYRNLVESYNPDAILTPFISNHDMDRSAGYLSVSFHQMSDAASLYMLTYGTPFIYYGEEIGMKGSRGTANTDANRRLAMLWGDGDTVEDPIGTTYDPLNQINGTVASQIDDESSLLNHYKKLIMIRNANPEIARGEYTPIDFDDLFSFGGFLSTYQNSTVGVFHNLSDYSATVDLSEYTDHEFTVVRAYVGVGTAELNGQTLTISPHTSVVLK